MEEYFFSSLRSVSRATALQCSLWGWETPKSWVFSCTQHLEQDHSDGNVGKPSGICSRTSPRADPFWTVISSNHTHQLLGSQRTAAHAERSQLHPRRQFRLSPAVVTKPTDPKPRRQLQEAPDTLIPSPSMFTTINLDCFGHPASQNVHGRILFPQGSILIFPTDLQFWAEVSEET